MSSASPFSADQQFLDDLDKKLWNAADRLRADYVMANPPFNISEWLDGRLEGDQRWVYGTPPKKNANFAWVQHMLHHLAPHGSITLLLANGSMSSNPKVEGENLKARLRCHFSNN